MSASEAGGSTPSPDLAHGREAFARRDWPVAFQLLRGVDPLGPKDTMALGTSAFLAGEADAAVRAWQRGYQERVGAGDPLGAVDFAFRIGTVLGVRGEWAVAAGWSARGQRILETAPEDVVQRGYLLVSECFAHLGRGDLVRAEEKAGRVVQIGRRFDDADLVAQGLMILGRSAIHTGRVPDGLALLDEAMVGVSAAEVSPIFSGMIYCSVIEGCQELADISRMPHGRGSHPVVRYPTRPGAFYRPVFTAPRPDPPPARCLRRSPGRVQPCPTPSRDGRGARPRR